MPHPDLSRMLSHRLLTRGQERTAGCKRRQTTEETDTARHLEVVGNWENRVRARLAVLSHARRETKALLRGEAVAVAVQARKA